MQTVIGVRFKKAGKIYYFSPGRLAIEKGDGVIVETARGIEYGYTVIGPREVEDSEVVLPLKVVQRKASEADDRRIQENKEREKEAFRLCEKKIAEHALPMKLVDVEYTFDLNKIVFYFTADGRIDFRELVKDLASVFRTRIELRQIGVRDEAKLMGGIGCCGRPLCCASFLGDFEPVSIRMAKEQNLSLNPTKISGICGRLMCCLKYESDCYEGDCKRKAVVQAPKPGSRIVSVEGEGRVISVNAQRRTTTILLDDNKTIVASWEDIVEKDEEEAPNSGRNETWEPASDEGEEKGQDAGRPAPDEEEGSHRRSFGNRPRKHRKEMHEKRDHKETKDLREKRDTREKKENRDEKEAKDGNRSRDNRSRRNRKEVRDREPGGHRRDRRPRGPRDSKRGGNGTPPNATSHGGYGTPFADVSVKGKGGE